MSVPDSCRPRKINRGFEKGAAMNKAIRKWIEEKHQPWRKLPERSILRGRIGAGGALPLNTPTQKYFEQQGVEVEGQLVEDLMEAELFVVLETISSWLTENDRRVLDESVAFGAARTHEPNAQAWPCLDGYAILFDYSFDTVLISATELYFALLVPPKLVSPEEFPLALNTAACSVFFNVADYWSPIPDEYFPHREPTNRWVWLMSVFLLAHEVGHVMKGHFDDALARNEEAGGDDADPDALRREHREEFEADKYAVELMLEGERRGGLMREGTNREDFWGSAYSTLGWLFSILEAIEILERRLELSSSDTHPPAAARWGRIKELIRARAPVSQSVVEFEGVMRGNARRAAEFGDLPAIRREMAEEIGSYVALPYSSLAAQILRRRRGGGEPAWTPPPRELMAEWFNASTLEEARDTLKRHPELLHPNVEELHYRMADDVDLHELTRAHIIRNRLPLWRRCRNVGVDAAFDELARGGPPADDAAETPLFEVTPEELGLFRAALDEGDSGRIQRLLDSSPELKAFSELPETALTLVRAASPLEAMQILQSHPELLIPTGDMVLARLAASQANEAARRTVETFRLIVARCRESGILLANIMTPSETGAGRAVLEADEGGELYARELREDSVGAEQRHRLQRPPRSVEEWLGGPLDVTVYRKPGDHSPLAFGTPVGFFWCLPPSNAPG